MGVSRAIVQVKDLHYTYRRGGKNTNALNGLSLEVAPGEIFGVLGPNGAGKTTLVRVLTTILRPSAGRAIIAGHDVSSDPLAVRRNIAVVLQENAVETLLSVRDNLLLYGYLHGLSRKQSAVETDRVAELLQLGPYLEKRAQTLSGGYKRRLQVAKALMVDTPVLFLDEATTGMDPLIKQSTIRAIRAEAKRGRTVLLTTQLLDEAESLCDRMILMDRGRSIATGNMAELRALSKKLFRITLSFENYDDAAMAELRSLCPVELKDGSGEIELVVEGSENEWIRKIAGLSERWPLAHFEIRGADLEQIFVELYGSRESEEVAE
jgi:ABC-2 type transport system ATP-binding protein